MNRGVSITPVQPCWYMLKKTSNLILLAIAISIVSIHSCSVKKAINNFNLFPVSEDIKLGLQVSKQIESSPQEFPILKERGNEEIYRYIRRITKRILDSGKVKYRNQFAWEVKIIDDDETLNAFATPGGYIYVYTGLIKFLDSEDQLAGVMGHEIAHADLRHSTRQMTKMYGVSILAQAVLGKKEAVEQVVSGLINLKFSRAHESESDEYSVIYLCPTGYNASGAAGFFKKMQGQRSPEFLSTHPNPTNRVGEIESKAKELRCSGKDRKTSEYKRMKGKI